MVYRTTVLLTTLTLGAIAPPKGPTLINLDNWMCLFLPPILFCAGVMIDKQNFDRNRRIIFIRGTICSLMSLICISTGASYFFPKLGIHHLSFKDYLAIGAIFIPNNFIFDMSAFPFPLLEKYDDHSILLGEGALSTATAVILLKLIRRHDFSFDNPTTILFQCFYFFKIIFTSTSLGMLVGWLFSFRGWIATNIVSKFIDSKYQLVVLRGTTTILFIPAYLTFILAEQLSLSGAISVFSYGVAVSHYMLPKDDTKEKTIWRDDIYRLSTLAKWASMLPIACFRKYYQWTNLGHRLGTFFSATGMLFFLLILGRAVSVIPLSSCWWLGKRKSIEEKIINDDDGPSALANPWNCRCIRWNWSLAKKDAKCYQPDILLFSRWGITNIAPQITIWGSAQNATRYLHCIIWMSALMPSLVSYVLAYEQFGKSGDDQQTFVFNLVATVCLFITIVCNLGNVRAAFLSPGGPNLIACFPFPKFELITGEDGREILKTKWWASDQV